MMKAPQADISHLQAHLQCLLGDLRNLQFFFVELKVNLFGTGVFFSGKIVNLMVDPPYHCAACRDFPVPHSCWDNPRWQQTVGMTQNRHKSLQNTSRLLGFPSK